MTEKKLGQGLAFPVDVCNDGHHSLENGMSQRLYLAGMAMQGILSNAFTAQALSNIEAEESLLRFEMVRTAYEVADELLKQENL